MVYEDCRIYGPYQRKDERKHIIVIFPDKKRKTVSYPKFLKEKEIKRYLECDETIDHKDGNFNNNELNNLQILTRSIHSKKDVNRFKLKSFICPLCGDKFTLKGGKLSRAKAERLRNKTGPFCSKKCAGKYGAMVQNGFKSLEVIPFEPEYEKML